MRGESIERYGFLDLPPFYEFTALPLKIMQPNPSSVQLHIHHHKIIRRQRLLKYRLQFFFACHGEGFGTVELDQASESGARGGISPAHYPLCRDGVRRG